MNKFALSTLMIFLAFAVSVMAVPLDCNSQFVDACRSLTQSNVVCNVSQSMNNSAPGSCLAIAGENVTLDCQGYTIGNGWNPDPAIGATKFNFTMKNCIVSDSEICVRLTGAESADNATLFNNSMNCTNYGIDSLEANATAFNNTIWSAVPINDAGDGGNFTCNYLNGTLTNCPTLPVCENITDCSILDAPNCVYNVTDDVSGNEVCVSVFAENVTLDCQGHTLYGDFNGETGGFGVYMNGYNYSVVKNCVFENWMRDVVVNDANYGLLTNNTYSDSGVGVSFSGDAAEYNVFNGSSFFNNTIDVYDGVGSEGFLDFNSFYGNRFASNVYAYGGFPKKNYWNATLGNNWTNSTHNGYSDTCDCLVGGYCSEPYVVHGSNNTDYKPLCTYVPPAPCSGFFACLLSDIGSGLGSFLSSIARPLAYLVLVLAIVGGIGSIFMGVSSLLRSKTTKS